VPVPGAVSAKGNITPLDGSGMPAPSCAHAGAAHSAEIAASAATLELRDMIGSSGGWEIVGVAHGGHKCDGSDGATPPLGAAGFLMAVTSFRHPPVSGPQSAPA
jgi:hypothetical protein